MQKSMQKTLAIILMTVVIASAISGFVSAIGPACDDSDKCKSHIPDKCTCNQLSCYECNDHCKTSENCTDPVDPTDPPVTDPAAGGGEEDPAAAGGGDPEEIPVAAAGEDTVNMQETGVPVGVLVMAVLMVLAGLALSKRK